MEDPCRRGSERRHARRVTLWDVVVLRRRMMRSHRRRGSHSHAGSWDSARAGGTGHVVGQPSPPKDRGRGIGCRGWPVPEAEAGSTPGYGGAVRRTDLGLAWSNVIMEDARAGRSVARGSFSESSVWHYPTCRISPRLLRRSLPFAWLWRGVQPFRLRERRGRPRRRRPDAGFGVGFWRKSLGSKRELFCHMRRRVLRILRWVLRRPCRAEPVRCLLAR